MPFSFFSAERHSVRTSFEIDENFHFAPFFSPKVFSITPFNVS